MLIQPSSESGEDSDIENPTPKKGESSSEDDVIINVPNKKIKVIKVESDDE